MVTSVSSGVLVNSGHLLENLVFTALRRLHPKIYYYKTQVGREVDFVLLRQRLAEGAKWNESLVREIAPWVVEGGDED